MVSEPHNGRVNVIQGSKLLKHEVQDCTRSNVADALVKFFLKAAIDRGHQQKRAQTEGSEVKAAPPNSSFERTRSGRRR